MRACLYALTVSSIAARLEAHAAPAKDAAGLKAERDAVRARAERARAALAAAETQRKDAMDAIAEADRALADAASGRSRPSARGTPPGAPSRWRRRRPTTPRARCGPTRRAWASSSSPHAEGAAEPLKLWLSNRDPADVARLSTYLAAIGRARADAIDRWRRNRERDAALAAAAEAARRAHDETMKDVAREAAAVDAMRREQQAVARARLDRHQAPARLARRAREGRGAAAHAYRAPGAPGAPEKRTPFRAAVRRTPAGKSDKRLRFHEKLSDAGERGTHWPVRRTKGRLGAPWRGWFIETAAGASVRAVAAGQVVWADWLRGFGNLLILDHGDGYMTLYGHNEALFPAVGAQVAAGEVVAQAGASGGAETPGVYFEVRYDGRAIDPAPWFARDAARE
jgi:septal ring factor EnvC (AmiA/AmiB activator)